MRSAPAGVVFVGDDRTDEEVFVMLDGAGCAICVGPGSDRSRRTGWPDRRTCCGFLTLAGQPALTGGAGGAITQIGATGALRPRDARPGAAADARLTAGGPDPRLAPDCVESPPHRRGDRWTICTSFDGFVVDGTGAPGRRGGHRRHSTAASQRSVTCRAGARFVVDADAGAGYAGSSS